jgi:hypothetical protein
MAEEFDAIIIGAGQSGPLLQSDWLSQWSTKFKHQVSPSLSREP